MCTYQAAHQCNINKPLNLDRCLCHHPPTMSEDQIRRWGNRESQKLPACKQTWNHTFCFNPGQPHHLISMYKRTSEYKCASKYKWHKRLKYFICHPREVTWQLSCWDWSLMPSWPSSAAKGYLRQIIWPLGALREASSWDLRAKILKRRTRSPEWKSAPLKMKVVTCWVGKNSQSNVKLFLFFFLEIEQILNLSSGLLLSTLGGDVCGLHRFFGWRWGLSCGLLCSLLCHVDWSSVGSQGTCR